MRLFNTARFRRHEIPDSGIGNPGLPFLVSFVLRNSKTNLKRFRIADSRSPICGNGLYLEREEEERIRIHRIL